MEGDKNKYLRDCDTGNDKCVKSFRKKDSATFVENGCSDQVDCNNFICLVAVISGSANLISTSS